MAFDPDNIEREITYDFKIKVKSCSLCPFSDENIDECGDYIGNTCTILEKYIKFPDCCEGIPNYCFLRKGKCNIKVIIG